MMIMNIFRLKFHPLLFINANRKTVKSDGHHCVCHATGQQSSKPIDFWCVGGVVGLFLFLVPFPIPKCKPLPCNIFSFRSLQCTMCTIITDCCLKCFKKKRILCFSFMSFYVLLSEQKEGQLYKIVNSLLIF